MTDNGLTKGPAPLLWAVTLAEAAALVDAASDGIDVEVAEEVDFVLIEEEVEDEDAEEVEFPQAPTSALTLEIPMALVTAPSVVGLRYQF